MCSLHRRGLSNQLRTDCRGRGAVHVQPTAHRVSQLLSGCQHREFQLVELRHIVDHIGRRRHDHFSHKHKQHWRSRRHWRRDHQYGWNRRNGWDRRSLVGANPLTLRRVALTLMDQRWLGRVAGQSTGRAATSCTNVQPSNALHRQRSNEPHTFNHTSWPSWCTTAT